MTQSFTDVSVIAVPDAERRDELGRLHERLEELSVWGFWGEDPDDEHQATTKLQADRSAAVPFHWRYKDIHPMLLKAAALVPMEMSERRSLLLINPSLSPSKATVTTMIAGYRVNAIDETMPPHRHSPNAIRFGLTGDTNFTGVEGENITFGPGDLVLTPQDTWHNHANGPDEASVNLSVLDMPLVDLLNATYFDFDYREDEGGLRVPKASQTSRVPSDYSQRTYGTGGLLPRSVDHHRGSGTSSPMFVYRWDQTRTLLEKLSSFGSPHEGVVVEYVNPTTGGPVYRTITFFAQMLRAGERLLPVRQSMNQIVTVFSGRGRTVIDDVVYDWEPFDTICIPGGSWYTHENARRDRRRGALRQQRRTHPAGPGVGDQAGAGSRMASSSSIESSRQIAE